MQTSSPSEQSEIKALTGLRGIAAIGVVLGHYQVLGFLNPWFQWHNAAVDLFFMLSGFTLSYVYLCKQPQGVKHYFLARVARILPLSILTTAIFALAFVVPDPAAFSQNPDRIYIDFLKQAVGINAWPVIGDGRHWNTPAWSISVEMFLYFLIFPLLAYLKPTPSNTLILIALIILPIASIQIYLKYFDWLYITALQPGNYSTANKLAPTLRGVMDFLAGYIVYCCYQNKGLLWDFLKNKSFAITLIIFFILFLSTKGVISNHYILLAFPVLILALTENQGLVQRFLNSPVMHTMGLWSYSIYLWQLPIKMALERVFRTLPFNANYPDYVIHAVTLFVLLVLSGISYRYFEAPVRTFIKTRFGGQTPLGV